MFRTQRPNFGLRFKTFIVMATICPLGRPLGWKNKKKYFEILWGGHHGENQNKHWKKKRKKQIFEESLGRAPWRKRKKKRKNKKNIWRVFGEGPMEKPKNDWRHKKKIEESLGRAPWRKQKKMEKQKNTNILRLLAYPSPSPRLLFFFLVVFSSFLFFPGVFFFKAFFFGFSPEAFRWWWGGEWEASKQHAMCSQCGGVQLNIL